LRKSFLVLIAIMACLSTLTSAQQAAAPQDVVRGFYYWYLHQLTLENVNPLKQKTTALKYLTPQLYANAPRLIRRMDADIFICAQDWDKGWEKNFSVGPSDIKTNTTTTTVTLPSGETDQVKIDVTLIKTASGWRINKVACAN
jgi:ABC-type transporter MlaC component